MLTHISKHGFIDLELEAKGDLYVDCHHTIEDVGIVFGKAISEALGEKKESSDMEVLYYQWKKLLYYVLWIFLADPI